MDVNLSSALGFIVAIQIIQLFVMVAGIFVIVDSINKKGKA